MDYVIAELAIECTWAEISGLKNLTGPVSGVGVFGKYFFRYVHVA